MDNELLKEYKDRNDKWAKRAIKQMSFYNNLLFTLTIAFLGFIYDKADIASLVFSPNNINYPCTFAFISYISMSFSLVFGLIAGISRLSDFRITRRINEIRQNIYKYSNIKYAVSSPNEYSLLRRYFLLFNFLLDSFPNIKIEDCINYKSSMAKQEKDKIDGIFETLRDISHNFGSLTWLNLRLQIVFFGLGFLFLFASVLA